MKRSARQVEQLSVHAKSDSRRHRQNCRPAPAWDRERLIGQFQRIDGSTRGDAEREVAAFEQSLWNGFANPHLGALPRSAKK